MTAAHAEQGRARNVALRQEDVIAQPHEADRSAKAPKPRPEVKSDAKPMPKDPGANAASSAKNTEAMGRSHGVRKSDRS